VILLLLACNVGDTRDGTVIGNPGDGLTVAARSASASFTEGATLVDTLIFEGCDGNVTEAPVEQNVDLVAGTSLALTAGDWCGLTLALGDAIELEAEIGGQIAVLDLEVPEIVLEGSFTVTEAAYVLELAQPDWLEDVDLDGDGDSDELEDFAVEVDEEHPSHDALAAIFADASALYADSNSDGVLSDAERTGALAAGSGRDDDGPPSAGDTGAESMGSRGCAGGKALLFLPLILGFRRRARPQSA